jgi:hypothetical protein
VNEPRTLEGWQVWDLVQRLGGQLRVASGLGGMVAVGWDLGAALALARALGVPEQVAAEWLPLVERVVIGKLNERLERDD